MDMAAPVERSGIGGQELVGQPHCFDARPCHLVSRAAVVDAQGHALMRMSDNIRHDMVRDAGSEGAVDEPLASAMERLGRLPIAIVRCDAPQAKPLAVI